jgi:hypothetical protein
MLRPQPFFITEYSEERSVAVMVWGWETIGCGKKISYGDRSFLLLNRFLQAPIAIRRMPTPSQPQLSDTDNKSVIMAIIIEI